MLADKGNTFTHQQIAELAERICAHMTGEGLNDVGHHLRLRLAMEQAIRPSASVPFGLDRLDIWDTSAYLNLQVDTLRDRAKRRRLGLPEPYTVGKKLAWRRSELDPWIEGQRRITEAT